MKHLLLALTLALAACGPNSAEIKTAKTATYKMKPSELLQLAEEVAQDQYKIGDVDAVSFTFMTQPRFYGPEGDLQSPGAGGFVHMQDRSVEVSFIVKVVEFGGDDVGVTVTPQTFQVLGGSPKPRELTPDDPNLPPFVKGRADQLALDIYNAAKSHAYPAK
ncbi:MAG: hypothetical protein JO257_09165 [Deltaproteobacteria bacterium]|nr:hypothetical protein [Deltaproteobacteria bacterium]